MMVRTQRWAGMLGVLSILAVVVAGAAPSNCRLYLASQYDWEAHLGFYLDFEGSELAELPLILGVADGSNWRFISHSPGFEYDRDYTVRAVIQPERAELLLDGALVAETSGKWMPAQGRPFIVNDRPSWANEKGDWVALARTVSATVLRGKEELTKREFDYVTGSADLLPLQLFEPGRPRSADLDVTVADTLVVDVSLRFIKPDLRKWAPFVDRYGQSTHAAWPEKVGSDEDLRADIAREDAELARLPRAENLDKFGGSTDAGWSEEATGFFQAVRRDGKWWLISPEGNPCFYLGVCNLPGSTWPVTPVSDREFLYEWLPPDEAPWDSVRSSNHWGVQDGTDYVCFHSANLIRKYGAEEWRAKAEERSLRRVEALGFLGGGKWGAPPDTVCAPVLGRSATPSLVEHPDVFDPEVRATFRADLEAQIIPRREDPYVLGWSLGNEYPEIIKRQETRDILGKPATVPAKKTLVDYALADLYGGDKGKLTDAWKIEGEDIYSADCSPPDEDIEALRLHYEDAYYAFVYQTIKQIDPNHLYMGSWIVPGWWESEDDWHVAARHCDMIGYDRYQREYPEERLAKLQEASDKPTLCGEFSFPSWYEGRRGYGRFPVSAASDKESGDLYYEWVRAAARDPYCTGLIWFHYRDQDLTGRGPGRGEELVFGEHYAFGLITITDRLKWDMVRRMREANLQAVTWRLETQN